MSCDNAHRFEGWFREPNDYLHQKESGLINCPVCGSQEVNKVLTASHVRTSGSGSATNTHEGGATGPSASAITEFYGKLQKFIEENFTDVGERFPEEVRKVYYGEAESRNLYGIAKTEEVIELLEEGIEVVPLPEYSRKPGKLN